MSTTVMTIQERLEQKARLAAAEAARSAAAQLPSYQGTVTIPAGMQIGASVGSADVRVNFSELKMLLRAFWEERYAESFLDTYTQELMAKIGR